MAPNGFRIYSKRDSQISDFVLEELSQWLHQLQVHGGRQTAHIVMGFYGCGGTLKNDMAMSHILIFMSFQKIPYKRRTLLHRDTEFPAEESRPGQSNEMNHEVK